MTDNLVKFPDVPSINKIQMAKRSHNEEAIEYIYEQIESLFTGCGYDLTSIKTNEKDLMMIYEALSSYVSRYYNIPHPVQNITDEMFSLDENEIKEGEEEFDFN